VRERRSPPVTAPERSAPRAAGAARVLLAACAALGLIAAAPPAHFAPASTQQLPNGARLVMQPIADTPLVAVQLFIPAGLAQQASNEAGVAAVAAETVLRTAENGQSVAALAAASGASLSYTLDPNDTRYSIECRSQDLPSLLKALVAALNRPDASQISVARAKVLGVAADTVKNPVAAALAMVRQVNYADSGFAYPDAGRPETVAQLTAAQVTRFLSDHFRAGGAVVSISGYVTGPTLDAVKQIASSLPSGSPPAPAEGKAVARQHQVVAHRSVDQPWVAIGYQAPTQFSRDFPAMLVVEALLGQGGDIHALSFGSEAALPEDFVGAYYQYQAQPGAFIVFLNGAGPGGVDSSIRELQLAIARLRVQKLPTSLVDHGRRLALGDYFMSVQTLADDAWLLGNAARSPQGLAYVDDLPSAIARVTSSDIRRVAQRYLTHETLGVVLPASGR